MKGSIFFSSIALLSAIILSACSSEWEGSNVAEEDIYQFETIEVPVTSDISLSDPESLINDEINNFGTRTLANIINSCPNKNITFSPISAIMAIAVYGSANIYVYGFDDDDHALHYLISYDDLADVNSVCNKLMRFLPYSSNGNCDISLANSSWLTNIVGPQPNFKDFLKNQFYAELYRYDTSTEAGCEILAERVRKWIEIKTKGEISNYKLENYGSSSIDYNVTYFKGEWLYKFDPGLTREMAFHSPVGDQLTDMMNGEFYCFPYWKSEKWQAVSLPFDMNYEMIFVLPAEGTPLVEAIPALGSCTASNCKYSDFYLSLPKFKIENKMELTDYFEVSVPFDVIQITKIEVDENGAKAVAVTEVTDGLHKYETLVFDRPFLYALVNKVTGTALMMGAVTTF